MANNEFTRARVCTIPNCDVCNMAGEEKQAQYDASVATFGGSWAYLCAEHFTYYGCQLGMGMGQLLVHSDTSGAEIENPALYDRFKQKL